MGKELLIMRHAKSSWQNSGLTDHDRPLNDRGLRDAPRMAEWLREQKIVPDLVLSSSANRAQSTGKILNDNFNVQMDIVEDFYLATPSIYVETIRNLNDQYLRPMVIGHNPGLEQLVYVLTGENEFMATAAVAKVTVPIESWAEFEEPKVKYPLQSVFRPKEIWG